MQVALVVEIGHAGGQCVVLDGAGLTRFSLAGARHRLIIGHDRFAARLAVNRPGRTVIVWVALFRAVIDVSEDAKSEFWVLIQYLAVRHIVAEMRRDEVIVSQYVLNQRANLLAPFDTRILFEDPMAFG